MSRPAGPASSAEFKRRFGRHEVTGEAARPAWDLLRGPVIGNLAVSDDLGPYVTPVCLAEREGRLYFHTGAGRRAAALARDPRICVAVTTDTRLEGGATPCRVGYAYRSVLVFGTAELLEESADRMTALDAIVEAHYPPVSGGDYDPEVLDETLVYEIRVEALTYKERPKP